MWRCWPAATAQAGTTPPQAFQSSNHAMRVWSTYSFPVGVKLSARTETTPHVPHIAATCTFAIPTTSDLCEARVPSSIASAMPDRFARCCLQSHSMRRSLLQCSGWLGPAFVSSLRWSQQLLQWHMQQRAFGVSFVPEDVLHSSSTGPRLNQPMCHARTRRFRQRPIICRT